MQANKVLHVQNVRHVKHLLHVLHVLYNFSTPWWGNKIRARTFFFVCLIFCLYIEKMVLAFKNHLFYTWQISGNSILKYKSLRW